MPIHLASLQDNFAQNGLSQVTHVSDTVLPSASPSDSLSAPTVAAPQERASQAREATSLPLSPEQVCSSSY